MTESLRWPGVSRSSKAGGHLNDHDRQRSRHGSRASPPNVQPPAEKSLTDGEVTQQLQRLMRAGMSNLRASLPTILGFASPASPAPSPAAPTAFQATCRNWTESIRNAPAALALGSSRLASLPPCSFTWPVVPTTGTDAPSAWGDDEVTIKTLPVAPTTAASRLLSYPLGGVPVVWDAVEGEGDEAWFDAEGDAAMLAGSVALAPLLSPVRSVPGTPVAHLDGDALVPVAASCRGASPKLGSGKACVEDLLDRPPSPLLPLPAKARAMLSPAKHPAGASLIVSTADRRCARLAAKPVLSAMDKALRVLHGKMGIEDPELPLEQARRLYVDSYKLPLPGRAIQAMVTLFRLNLPSITARTRR